jgi:hypothetical protein
MREKQKGMSHDWNSVVMKIDQQFRAIVKAEANDPMSASMIELCLANGIQRDLKER